MRQYVYFILIILFSFSVACSSSEPGTADADITVERLKEHIVKRTNNFKDITQTAVITYKNKKALAKVEESFTRLYEFKSAKVLAKSPNKMRTEGKLGMVSFTYIIDGTTRYVKIPSIRINKKDDYKKEPSKVQDLLDIGIVTQGAWSIRELKILPDAEASARGEILLSGGYPNNTMQNLFWIDAKEFYLKRFEKRTPEGKTTISLVYSKPQLIDKVIWIPTVVEIFAPDGERAGAMELRDIKVNTGISDEVFR